MNTTSICQLASYLEMWLFYTMAQMCLYWCHVIYYKYLKRKHTKILNQYFVLIVIYFYISKYRELCCVGKQLGNVQIWLITNVTLCPLWEVSRIIYNDPILLFLLGIFLSIFLFICMRLYFQSNLSVQPSRKKLYKL